MTRLHVTALLVCIPLAAGCSWLPGRREARAREEAMAEVMRQTAQAQQVREATAPVEIPSNDTAIEFEATGEGNTVHFTITNHGAEELYVGPQNLALIPLPERELIHATDAERVLCRFYPVTLAMGEAAAGELVFLTVSDTAGMRLVYNTNQLSQGLWRADILPPSSEQAETPAPSQP